MIPTIKVYDLDNSDIMRDTKILRKVNSMMTPTGSQSLVVMTLDGIDNLKFSNQSKTEIEGLLTSAILEHFEKMEWK